MATNMHITPELEVFMRRGSFKAMLDGVRMETERDGAVDLDTVLVEIDTIIDRAER